MAEQAFYAWLEGVCLDEDNQAFEKEDSPFADRETEVVRAITREGCSDIERGEDLIVFIRRRSKDCRRILEKLESWFLRRYDIRHSSSIIHHARAIDRSEDDAKVTLSWHTPRNHALALGTLLAPFVAAAFGYARYPFVFDAVCSAEVLLVNAVAVWFLLYRFCWKRDLSFFHASVPRIGAGIIVGYLPVFLIDEVWSLASRSAATLTSVGTLLGLVTLLYIYVEVQRRLGDPAVAFARARAIFLLGVLEAFGFGVVMTSMTGSLMVSRNWSPQSAELSVEALRQSVPPLVGDLPRIIGPSSSASSSSSCGRSFPSPSRCDCRCRLPRRLASAGGRFLWRPREAALPIPAPRTGLAADANAGVSEVPPRGFGGGWEEGSGWRPSTPRCSSSAADPPATPPRSTPRGPGWSRW
jgi:hypothetical protein